MRSAGVGEIGMREADAFEVGQVVAELAETFVVDRAAPMADAGHLDEAFELGVGLAGDLGADDGEILQIFEAGELRHAVVGDLAVIGETQGLEVRELGDGRHPVVVELRRDDIERLERVQVADVLEERRIIRVVLTMIVGAGAGHVEVDELHALAIGGQFDLALGPGDDTRDGFDVGVEGVGGNGE